MVSKAWTVMLVAAAASIMTLVASGQTKPDAAAAPIVLMPGEMDAAMYRTMTISLQGLKNPALEFTPTQQIEIDKIIEAYVAEQMALSLNAPAGKSSAMDSDEFRARQAIAVNFTAKLSRVMNDTQRKIWEAGLSARRPAIPKSQR
jgi:hypothetical protein